MSARKCFAYAVFALVTTIAGQDAFASPCNKRLWQQASIRCAGNQQCIANIYLQATNFNAKGFLQCKTDQWNQMTGDNKTSDELFNSKTMLGPNTYVPTDDPSGYTYGNAYRRGDAPRQTEIERDDLEKYRQEIDAMTKVIKTRPKYAAQAYFNRALAKDNLKDYQGAIDDYSKAISINPQNASAYANRGIVKQLVGDMDGACADWGRASSMGNKNAAKWVNEEC